MKQFFFFTLCLFSYYANAQNVGINATGAAPNSSAILDVSATNKGLLLPRVSLTNATDATTIASPATALIVYNTNAANTGGLTGTGLYINKGTAALPDWKKIQDGPVANGWALTGNSGIDSLANFLGTTDNKPLMFRVNNNYAGRIGTDGIIALGVGSLAKNYYSGNNIGIGDSALNLNIGGEDNVALGRQALKKNFGNANVAVGNDALINNHLGYGNVAMGTLSGSGNTSGNQNVAVGNLSLVENQTGNFNIAVGGTALHNNTASNNIAIGYSSLYRNNIGTKNIAIGNNAARNNSN
ncbi:MAG: hypothetical protein LH615_15330 [Ferruginibacter sp.]|nr:hypothetical protein [Ferruginibacter sp.]